MTTNEFVAKLRRGEILVRKGAVSAGRGTATMLASLPPEAPIESLTAEAFRLGVFPDSTSWETGMEALLEAMAPEPVEQKYNPDQPRVPAGSPGGGQFSSGGGSGSPSGGSVPGGISIRPASRRVFSGQPVATRTTLSKSETGKIGEQIAVAWLRQQGFRDTTPLNAERNNFPIDLIQDHEVIEVKAGLVSNRTDAQKWRLTIGEPGPAEQAWLARATPTQKAALNAGKEKAILQRKEMAMRQIAERRGGRMPKASTVTMIINPDTKTADLYKFSGFHAVIRWNGEQARAAYVGTVRYGR